METYKIGGLIFYYEEEFQEDKKKRDITFKKG